MDNNKTEQLKEKAKLSGCEMTDEQALFLVAELEKEWVLNSYLSENGLEFANMRTRQSIIDDFDKLIFDPLNKDKPFEILLESLLTDENGEFDWDLFTPESGKKHRLIVCDDKGDIEKNEVADTSNALPPCGNIDASEKNNPFDKDSWNMAEQSRIYKENPDIAKELAAMAKRGM